MKICAFLPIQRNQCRLMLAAIFPVFGGFAYDIIYLIMGVLIIQQCILPGIFGRNLPNPALADCHIVTKCNIKCPCMRRKL
jgi:hypothetical protein